MMRRLVLSLSFVVSVSIYTCIALFAWAPVPSLAAPKALPPVVCPAPLSCKMTFHLGKVFYNDRAGNRVSWLDNTVLTLVEDNVGGVVQGGSAMEGDQYNGTKNTSFGQDFIYTTFFDVVGTALLSTTFFVERGSCYQLGHRKQTGTFPAFQGILKRITSYQISQTPLWANQQPC